jgi:hypothetical protein
MIHPEAPEGMSEIFEEVYGSSIGLVRCKGCGVDRVVNSKYLQYLADGIQECRFCRAGEFGVNDSSD